MNGKGDATIFPDGRNSAVGLSPVVRGKGDATIFLDGRNSAVGLSPVVLNYESDWTALGFWGDGEFADGSDEPGYRLVVR
jgi:hypothetical protein